MAPVDWLILVAMLGVMVLGVLASRRRMRSVADFLAAGRSAGRYLLSVCGGIAGLGAITIVGLLEMNYLAGFSMSWWSLTMGVVILVITVSGWVVYRFRQTRALTLAEFFERRYSRRFRVFAGLVAFLSGLINFGIFPAVGARFFVTYCGLPPELVLAGLAVPTFPLVMACLLGISLFFVYAGGQVAVIVTDFIQGTFVNIVFILVVLVLLVRVDWSQMVEALSFAPENASLINPFETGHVEDFNFGYFLIGIFGVLYGTMSWQGTQGYNVSARSAHEAKMGGVLGNWRGIPQGLFLLIVPIVAYTVMRHPDFAAVSGFVDGELGAFDSEPIRSQLRTPLVLTRLLPVGLIGAFAAVMLAAFVSTHDTYLHSWASIFIQDVVMPFRKKPLTQAQHLRLLRLAIFGVALFIFGFSLIFQQSEYIFLFFAITGAIFAGGSGAVIIGGLYWKRGTAAAAWTAMITGSSIAVGGILIHQLPAALFDASHADAAAPLRAGWAMLAWLYEINGQQYWAVAMFASTLLYVAVSLVGRRRVFELDRLLHRGAYSLADERRVVSAAPARGWRLLGMGPEFTGRDKTLYILTYCWTFSWTLVFAVGTTWNLSHRPPPEDYSALPEPARSALVTAAPLMAEQEWDAAAAELERALAEAPATTAAPLFRRLGVSLLRLDRAGEAVPHLERAVLLAPTDGKAWTALGEASTRVGRLERAQAASERGAALLGPQDRAWARYWRNYVLVQILFAVLVTVWFTAGGLRDLRAMFGRLDSLERDAGDDGRVRAAEPGGDA